MLMILPVVGLGQVAQDIERLYRILCAYNPRSLEAPCFLRVFSSLALISLVS